MSVSREVVERLAEMTRIGLAHAEAEALGRDIEAILAHVSALQEIDTAAVEGAPGAGSDAPLREDVVAASLPVADVLANAPQQADGFFVVPAVFGE